MTTIERRRALVKAVQSKTATPNQERELAETIESLYRPHRLNNHIYNADDMKQEFLIASWNAVFRAKLDVGDPVMFCINRGRGAMLDYYRTVSAQKLTYVCQECAAHLLYDKRTTHCRFCKSTNLKSYEKEEISTLRILQTDQTTKTIKNENTELFDLLIFYLDNYSNNSIGQKLTQEMISIARSALEHGVPFDQEAQVEYHKSPSWANYFKCTVVKFLTDSMSEAETAS